MRLPFLINVGPLATGGGPPSNGGNMLQRAQAARLQDGKGAGEEVAVLHTLRHWVQPVVKASTHRRDLKVAIETNLYLSLSGAAQRRWSHCYCDDSMLRRVAVIKKVYACGHAAARSVPEARRRRRCASPTAHRHHHIACGATDAVDRPGQSTGSSHSGDDATAGDSAHSWPDTCNSSAVALGRGRTLDRERNHLFTSEQHEAQTALLELVGFGEVRHVLLAGSSALLFDGTELLAIAEHEVHVLVEGHEGAHQRAAVLDCDAHAVVDVTQHLALL